MYLGGEEQWHQAKGLYHHLHHITLREKLLEHIQHRTLQTARHLLITHHCCLVTTVDHLNLVQILYLTESWAKRLKAHILNPKKLTQTSEFKKTQTSSPCRRMKRSWLASSLIFAIQFSVLSHAAPRFSMRRPGFDILLTLIYVAFWLHIGWMATGREDGSHTRTL